MGEHSSHREEVHIMLLSSVKQVVPLLSVHKTN